MPLASLSQDDAFKWNAEDSENLSLIFEVRNISKKKKEFVVSSQPESMWTALPIFRKNTRYVDSGCFTLPLFEGKVPQAALDASDIYEWICADIKKGKKERMVDLSSGNSSLVVRIADACVDEFTERQTDSKFINSQYVRKACAAAGKEAGKFDYNPGAEIGKPMAKLLGNKKDQDRVAELKEINKAMAAATGITHYIFD